MQSRNIRKAAQVLSLVRVHSALMNGQVSASALGLDDAESSAIYALTDRLLSDDESEKEVVLQGLFTSQGEFQGVSCKLPHHFSKQQIC